jgi:hypothetical protein
MFMKDRARFLLLMVRELENLLKRVKQNRKLRRKLRKLCVRLNGATDIAWEGIRFLIERDRRGKAIKVMLGNVANGAKTIFEHYADTQFVDYTKNPNRFQRALPANYHLTFSRSEVNEAIAIELLQRGVNVAVVFGGDKPATWNGHAVVDGDETDLRHLDPRGDRGFVIGLSPKGRRAKKDTMGFVVR